MPIMLMTEDEVATYGRSSDAGFGALQTARGLLPLAAMDVDAKVAGVVASIEIAQTFVNTTGTAIEATYIFPLPDRAAVNRFRMEVSGRVIEGVIDERGAAREQYEEAIAAGHRAAITEQERPGVFTLRVGNLMPGESATVRLSLVGPLPVDDGEVTLQFPLVVAPRYMPGAGLGGDQAGLGIAEDTSLVPDASRISPPVLLPGCPNPVRLGIRVALADHHVRDVASSLHAVTTTLRDAQVLEIQPGERLNRDFILRWRIDDKELRSSLVCADDADGKGGSFMLTLVPPSTLAMSQKPRDVGFVIDRSGSMGGWKMAAARRATARMIDTLTSRDRFCVIAFDNVIETLPEAGLSYASDRVRYKAVEQLAKLEARGGTEMFEPLQYAAQLLSGGHDDRERVIVLVTDGQVGNEDHILRQIAPSLKNVRVFTLGIDQAVNAGFLKRFASVGGGLCELVESEDRLDAVMAKVHRRIGTPVATELHLEAKDLDVHWGTIAPAKLPDVYAGAPVVVLGRYKGAAPSHASLTMSGTTFGDPLKLAIARDAEQAGTWLGASWARAHIRELEDRYAIGARELEPEIVRVSKQFSVLSRFTAFLAVDRSEVVNKGGNLVQAVQPVDQPAGWEGGGGGKHYAPMAGGVMPPPKVPPMVSLGRKSAMPMSAAPPPMQPAPQPGPHGFGAPGMPRPGYSGGPPADARAPRPTEASPMPAPPFDMLERERGISMPQGPNASPPKPRPAPPSAAMTMPPPAPPPRARNVSDKSRNEKAETADASAYLEKLAQLARDLAHARGGDLGALRLLRQRLTEWVEDLRSVGGHDALADAVEAQVKRLSAVLTGGGDIASEVMAISTELARLAGGGAPPAKKPGRSEFWK
ncbi:MAG TPA: VIT domain-containing protein [Kofleriaceae bacterium]